MKKGFTLVELLAVIAILAVLVIIAMPNVLELFNGAKKDVFVTEIQALSGEAVKAYYTSGKKAATVCKSYSDDINGLNMEGREMYYYFEISQNRKLSKIIVWNDSFYVSFEDENGVELDKITDEDVKELTDYKDITCVNVKEKLTVN